MEQKVVFDVPGELLDDVRHVADLLLQLLDLVLELLRLLNRRVDLLDAQSRYCIVKLTGTRILNKNRNYCQTFLFLPDSLLEQTFSGCLEVLEVPLDMFETVLE